MPRCVGEAKATVVRSGGAHSEEQASPKEEATSKPEPRRTHDGVVHQQKRQRFEELVLEAVEALPQRFLDRLANIDIEVRDWPSREELGSAQVPAGRTLMGLYVGVPHTRRRRYHLALPDRIFIYRRPIERLCRSEAEVRERVGRVIKHEIAHHFGLTEADLHDTSVS
jgi:predicted Zn-dependent protease with MMP-like domain